MIPTVIENPEAKNIMDGEITLVNGIWVIWVIKAASAAPINRPKMIPSNPPK